MSTITAATLSLETVRPAVKFVIGQDQTPETSAAPATSTGRWKRDSIYAAAEDETWDDADWEDDQIAWEDEEAWLAEDEGAPYYSLQQTMQQQSMMTSWRTESEPTQTESRLLSSGCDG